MNKFRTAILGGSTGAPSTPVVSAKHASGSQGDSLSSIAVARETARSADHRDEDRHRLARETASIGYRDKILVADLINLSGGGAMIEADISPRLWDRVDLHLGEGDPIECAVRWLRKGRIGLEFAHETHLICDPEQRDALLIEVIRRSFPDLIPPPPPVAADPAPLPDAQVVGVSRRAESRHPLIWNGSILWQHDEHKVRLRNISASGVLVDTQVDFPPGVELLLDLGESGQYFATVSWARSGQAGLLFKQPFDLAMLAAARPEIAAQCWDRPSYLDLSSSQSSPWASQWARRDLSDIATDLEGFLRH